MTTFVVEHKPPVPDATHAHRRCDPCKISSRLLQWSWILKWHAPYCPRPAGATVETFHEIGVVSFIGYYPALSVFIARDGVVG